MSDSRAIEAVTATIRNVLLARVQADLPGSTVTTAPPDQAPVGEGNHLNLFLHKISVDGGLRNLDRWPPTNDGAALPLVLSFLITAYGENADEAASARLLGSALCALQDNPVLGRDQIRSALPESNLDTQVERVRLTFEPISPDDMSRMWTAFQTQYRLSINYAASVVVLDSSLAPPAAMPVLRRGRDDRGPVAAPSVSSPFPRITGVTPNARGSVIQPAFPPGTGLRLTGRGLRGAATVRWRHAWSGRTRDIPLDVTAAADDLVLITVPDDAATFPAGTWAVSVVVPTPTGSLTSNALPLSVSPVVADETPTGPLSASGSTSITIRFTPFAQPGQQLQLLLGDRAFPVPVSDPPTGDATVPITGMAAGAYPSRLRVDGVDSAVMRAAGEGWEIDPARQVALVGP